VERISASQLVVYQKAKCRDSDRAFRGRGFTLAIAIALVQE